LVNGKIYVGVHKLADTSYSRSYLGSGCALKPAIEKYGKENFRRATLAEFSCAKDAYEAETQMVTEEFCNRKNTYNLRIGGEGGIFTEEARVKMSAAAKGKQHTPETRAKMSASHKGKIITAEAKAKIGAASKGNKHRLGSVASLETRAKMSASQKGRTASEETKIKLSNAAKGRVLSEEHKAKLSALRTGRTTSAETKNKMSIANGRPVVLHGKYYTSSKKAAKINEIAHTTLRWRLNNPSLNWIEWRYATEEEVANFLREGVAEVQNLFDNVVRHT
jgi:group I intron endonuclease